MNSKYKWHIESFAKKIDPEIAVQELERIENIFGSLTAETILNASVDPDSVFHSLFTWDNDEAAKQYRLQQARLIINNIQVITISDGEERSISVYEIVSSEAGRSYKQITSMSSDDLEQVKKRTIKELNYLKAKLSFYKTFEKAVIKITEAVELIEEK